MPLRRSHPNLFLSLIIMSSLDIFYGLNIFAIKAAFTPFDLDNRFAGGLLTLLGIALLTLTLIHHMSVYRRLVLLSSMSFYLIFALGSGAAFFDHKTRSLAGLIIFGFEGIRRIPTILEPPINPATKRGSDGHI